VDVGQLVYLLAKIGLFFGLTIMFGEFIMPKLTRHLTDEAGKGFTFAMTVALALAYLAEQAGLHLVIGAFLAGQFVRREIMDEKIYEAIADRFYGISYGFLVPIFFASLSFHLDLQWTFWFWGMAGAFLVAAVIGKVVGAALAARVVGFGWSEAKVVGVGMNGRGAVELVIGSVAVNTGARLMDAGVLDEPLLTGGQFSVLVVVAFGGAFITPLVLKSILRKVCLPEEYEAYCQLTDEIAPDGRARVKYDPKAR
jgi:Kef-type K+ transport system membrane component KefB